MSEEFASSEPMDVPAAEVLDVAPESAAETPAFAFEYGAASRGFRDGFTADEWAGMSDSARAKVEAMGRTLGGVDEGFRTVQGKYDSTTAELTKLREERIIAETRARTLEEVQTRQQAPAEQPPQFSLEQILDYKAKIARQYTEHMRVNGYDSQVDAEWRAQESKLDRMANQTRAYHQKIEASRAGESAGYERDMVREVYQDLQERRASAQEEAFVTDLSQKMGISKETLRALQPLADEMIASNDTWGLSPAELRVRHPRDYQNFIALAAKAAKAGMGMVNGNGGGQGAPARAVDPRGLPGRSASSAGFAPQPQPSHAARPRLGGGLQ